MENEEKKWLFDGEKQQNTDKQRGRTFAVNHDPWPIMLPIWMETMATIIKIDWFQQTEWLTDALVHCNPAAFS